MPQEFVVGGKKSALLLVRYSRIPYCIGHHTLSKNIHHLAFNNTVVCCHMWWMIVSISSERMALCVYKCIPEMYSRDAEINHVLIYTSLLTFYNYNAKLG